MYKRYFIRVITTDKYKYKYKFNKAFDSLAQDYPLLVFQIMCDCDENCLHSWKDAMSTKMCEGRFEILLYTYNI